MWQPLCRQVVFYGFSREELARWGSLYDEAVSNQGDPKERRLCTFDFRTDTTPSHPPTHSYIFPFVDFFVSKLQVIVISWEQVSISCHLIWKCKCPYNWTKKNEKLLGPIFITLYWYILGWTYFCARYDFEQILGSDADAQGPFCCLQQLPLYRKYCINALCSCGHLGYLWCGLESSKQNYFSFNDKLSFAFPPSW